jgi:hypothetical protein
MSIEILLPIAAAIIIIVLLTIRSSDHRRIANQNYLERWSLFLPKVEKIDQILTNQALILREIEPNARGARHST